MKKSNNILKVLGVSKGYGVVVKDLTFNVGKCKKFIKNHEDIIGSYYATPILMEAFDSVKDEVYLTLSDIDKKLQEILSLMPDFGEVIAKVIWHDTKICFRYFYDSLDNMAIMLDGGMPWEYKPNERSITASGINEILSKYFEELGCENITCDYINMFYLSCSTPYKPF